MSVTVDRPLSGHRIATRRETTARVSSGEYRPHLDGLRAVAVYLVVAFHANAHRVDGGFIGVDVFFVLSGYLVTELLLRDVHKSGSIDLRRFYSRRFRRLLPAALVTLVVTAIVFRGIATPAELTSAGAAMTASSLYVANWYFIHQASDYFAANVRSSPVLHFWSLSIEEQFYATWPLLLLGLHGLARRLRARATTFVGIVVAIGLVLSLGNALRLQGTNLNRAYYGTDTRAYQLLAGALLALLPAWRTVLRDRGRQRIVAAVGVSAFAGLLLAATSLISVGAITRGVLATVLTVTVIVSIESALSPVRSLLSSGPFVYLGRISYGTYLWHWLVIVVAVQTFDLSPFAVFLIAVVVGSGLASLSYQILERPVRESRRLDHRRRTVIGVGLAGSLLVGLVVIPHLLDRDTAGASVAVARGTTVNGQSPIPAGFDWRSAEHDHPPFPDCSAADPQQCVLVHGTGKHVLLVGDSNAEMYLPALTELARERSLTLSAAVAPGCPWQNGILRRGEGQVGAAIEDLGPPCRARHADWYGTIIPALHPDVVIAVDEPFDDPTSIRAIQDEDTGPVEVDSDAFQSVVRRRTADTIAGFVAEGSRVVIVEPVPLSSDQQHPIKCLSQAKFFEECRFVSHTEPTPLERIYRDIAAHDPAHVVDFDLDRAVCPYLPICDPVVNGLIVRWDPEHLTTHFAASLSATFAQLLDDNGLLQ